MGTLRHVPCQTDQLIGGLSHRRDHHDDPIAGGVVLSDALGDMPDAICIRKRGAAELLDDQGHSVQSVGLGPDSTGFGSFLLSHESSVALRKTPGTNDGQQRLFRPITGTADRVRS